MRVVTCSGSSANVAAGQNCAVPAFRTNSSYVMHHINGKVGFVLLRYFKTDRLQHLAV